MRAEARTPFMEDLTAPISKPVTSEGGQPESHPKPTRPVTTSSFGRVMAEETCVARLSLLVLQTCYFCQIHYFCFAYLQMLSF